MDDADVVVVGAGLAGLAAANRLTDAGPLVLVLEAIGSGAGSGPTCWTGFAWTAGSRCCCRPIPS
ncbi:FAD-binding protein [Kribbella sp. NPDC049174]|uniref:FAD-binding protein n=1 Tax=Kribbella sp. NPDC049174 TaxID=3364112 RepID=UPI00371CC087